jgi:hypothetical protein
MGFNFTAQFIANHRFAILKKSAFAGTNPTDDSITSRLPVIRPESASLAHSVGYTFM